MGCISSKLRLVSRVFLVLAAVNPDGVLAQAAKDTVKKEPPRKDAVTNTAPAQTGPAAAAPAAGAASVRPPLPSTVQMTLLIQNSMAAASQAIKTGNYTVMHGLAAPSFQQVNPPERLSQIFAKLRASNIDITPVILHQPILTSQPALDDKAQLRLTGYYDTKPQNVVFDTLYVIDRGQWLLHGISITTRAAAAAAVPEQQK